MLNSNGLGQLMMKVKVTINALWSTGKLMCTSKPIDATTFCTLGNVQQAKS